jgi:hypothetical protein
MPTYTIEPSTRPSDPFVAEVLRRLLARAPDRLDPWLPFPQNACSYRFGRAPRPEQPLPIGALWRLWDSGFPFRAPCPACDATLHMFAMGGLLTIGGGLLVCPGCSGGYFCSIGNVTTVGALVSERLQGTEFRPAGFVFGGAVGSDGAALLAELGLARFEQAEEGVVTRADGLRTRIGFGDAESVVHEDRREGGSVVHKSAGGAAGAQPADQAPRGLRVHEIRTTWSLILNRILGR